MKIEEIEKYLNHTRIDKVQIVSQYTYDRHVSFLLFRIRELEEGIEKLLSAPIWSHNHWDSTMQHGAGCLICIEQSKARQELCKLLEKR